MATKKKERKKAFCSFRHWYSVPAAKKQVGWRCNSCFRYVLWRKWWDQQFIYMGKYCSAFTSVTYIWCGGGKPTSMWLLQSTTFSIWRDILQLTVCAIICVCTPNCWTSSEFDYDLAVSQWMWIDAPSNWYVRGFPHWSHNGCSSDRRQTNRQVSQELSLCSHNFQSTGF